MLLFCHLYFLFFVFVADLAQDIVLYRLGKLPLSRRALQIEPRAKNASEIIVTYKGKNTARIRGHTDKLGEQTEGALGVEGGSDAVGMVAPPPGRTLGYKSRNTVFGIGTRKG